MRWVIRWMAGISVLMLSTGCAPMVTPDIMVAIPSANGVQWSLSLATSMMRTQATVSLSVNHQVAATGSGASPFKIVGTYANHPIQALCSYSLDQSLEGTCYVYVDGTQVATLPMF